jgi:hypothetical protein
MNSNRVNIISRKKAVIISFTIHTLVMIIILLTLVVFNVDYSWHLLKDDGYYSTAGRYIQGDFSPYGNVIGPGLPAIYMVIYLFPEILHPFIRLLISQMFIFIILYTLSKITVNKLSNKQYLLGSLLIVLNPIFIHYTFRSIPDTYLAGLLGIFILAYLRFYERNRIISLMVATISLSIGIFIRPSFILIPFVILLYSLIYKRNIISIATSTILILVALLSLFLNNVYIEKGKALNRYESVEDSVSIRDVNRYDVVILNFILTETIINTGRFHKGTVDNYGDTVSGGGVDYLYERVDKFINEYYDNYPEGSAIGMVLYYAKENPLVTIMKIILSPIFFFSLSSREIMSYSYLLISIVYLLFAIRGSKAIIIREIKNKNHIMIILYIIFGYILLHIITHGYSRYSIAVLPYLYIWVGVSFQSIIWDKVENIIKETLKRYR